MGAVNNRRGFTLVEVIVILAVLAILAAMAVPVALRIFERTADDATRDEMANIKKAMVGDPQKLQGSFRSNFAFLGDIGCLPTVLDRLLTAGALPTPYTFDSTKQAGAGWNGPYITGAAQGDALSEYTKDQLGNAYTYSASGGCPLTATLTSNGANGIFESGSGDDIVISIASTETTATAVQGTVKDTAGNLLEAVPVEFYSAVGGSLITAGPVNTDASGNYSFSSVPFGPRAVKAKPNFLYGLGSVTGGGGTTITFRILNYAESAVQINRMRVDWTTGGGNPAQWDRLRINLTGTNNTCFGVAATNPGVVVTVNACVAANRTVAVSPALRPSTRVFIDTNNVSLPDTTITGAATSATMDIRFTGNVPGGSMPITITFNPSPLAGEFLSVVKFTP